MKHIPCPQPQTNLVPILLLVLLVVALVALIFYLWQQKIQGEKKLQHITLQAETLASRLPGYSTAKAGMHEGDALSILASLDDLLSSVLKGQRVAKHDLQPERQPTPVYKREQEKRPSDTAKALIDMRDGMLLAIPKEGEKVMDVKVLESFYEDLGAVLAREGITSLEETGSPYNQERQQIVGTQITSDPRHNNIVCSTESPGYLFQGKLLRPQGVVIYKFQAARA